jgi:selenocysteine-specific elongation factor
MIIGTAGHIDHGKSTLVTALTGRAMDRLAEERRRGITIELNFAPLELEGLPPIGIVDVPGHEDFVRTMVAGATGIDLVLLVVDAVEGIRPQTLEHLAIVEQLGIPRGIPVLTKLDLADPEWVELVEADLRERLERSPVRFASPVRVSPVTGVGMDLLRQRLRECASRLAVPDRRPDVLRLPVDRAFAIAGTGPVVTGTLWSGSIAVGDQVRIEPGRLQARVRSVESFGRPVERVEPGSRTAVGLSGVELADLRRGQVVLGSSEWEPVTLFDASISLLPEAPRPLLTRARIRVHHGTAEVIGRVYPRKAIAPGETGPARIVLEAPLVVRGGDRFVIRSYSPVNTIGGGWIADPEPPRRARWPEGLVSRSRGDRFTALLQRRPGGIRQEQLSLLLGPMNGEAESAPEVVQVGGRYVLRERVEAARKAVLMELAAFHQRDPAAPGRSIETIRAGLGDVAWLADELLRELQEAGTLRVSEGLAALATHRPRSAGGEGEVDRLLEAIQAAGLEGPTVAELSERLKLKDLPGALKLAVARGLIDAVERDRFVSLEALSRFEQTLREVGKGNVEISPAAVRDRLGLTRKHLIPLLEWADRRGITWRDREGVRRLKN